MPPAGSATCSIMIECFGLSDTGCLRTNNEDYFLLAEPLGLAVLADGMGGANAGERASQLAVDTVVRHVECCAQDRSPEMLRAALDRANQEVLSLARSDRRLEGMGTTLVAALDLGSDVIVASVGDSRAYLFEPGALRPVTQDQSWVNEVGRALGMDEAALKIHPLRHVLTMAIGAGSRLVVNTYRQPWNPGSLLMLSSDGLHGVVPNERIEELLHSGATHSLEENCRRLIAAAKELGGPDNITVVLLRRVA